MKMLTYLSKFIYWYFQLEATIELKLIRYPDFVAYLNYYVMFKTRLIFLCIIIFFTFINTETSRCQVQTYTIGVTTKNAWQEESFPAVLHTLWFAHSILSSAECK